jgi:hypothetical protein
VHSVDVEDIARGMYESSGAFGDVRVPWFELTPEFKEEYLADARVALSYMKQKCSEEEATNDVLRGVIHRLETDMAETRRRELERQALTRVLAHSYSRLQLLYDEARTASTPAQKAEVEIFESTLEALRRSYNF